MKTIQVKELRIRDPKFPCFAPEKDPLLGHRFELIVRDGRTVCVVIPDPVPKEKMDVIYSIMPDGSRLDAGLSNSWGVWGVIYNRDYRPAAKRPAGYKISIL